MTKLEQYKIQRDGAQLKLTRVKDYIASFNASTGNLNQLKVRLEILSDARRDFENMQQEIEQLDKTTSVQDHLALLTKFEDEYCDLVSQIRDIIDKASTNPVPAVSSQTNNNAINLPVLNLKTFNGNYKDWLNFENSFKSIIEENKSLNNIRRFQYLKSCLRDDALRAIDSLAIDEVNYLKVWDILENRFKNVRLIVQDHVSTILNAPTITKSSHTALRELLDTITSNMTSLKMLNIPVDSWDALIIPIVLEKLDYSTKREWQVSLDKSVPTFSVFQTFLEKRCVVLESLGTIPSTKSNVSHFNNSKLHNQNQKSKFQTVTHATIQNKKMLCLFCKNTTHYISQCEDFSKLIVKERSIEVSNRKLCTNCLRNNHLASNCHSKSKCRVCNEKHHSLLHPDTESDKIPEITYNAHSYSAETKSHSVLLSTAIILIKDQRNDYHPCRAFLDQGSMANYITSSLCKKLGLKLDQTNVEIKCLNGTTCNSNKQTKIIVKSRVNSYSANLNCLVVNKITDNIPLNGINPAQLELPSNINLADPYFYESNKIDLLIGAGLFWDLLCIGQITVPSGLVFQKTHFGFIAGGTYCSNISKQTSCHLSNVDINNRMLSFFELENNVDNSSKILTDEETECQNHFCENTFHSNNRFLVKLPIINNQMNIGDTKQMALKRFYNLERRLNKDPELKTEYCKFINEYHKLGHMEEVVEPLDSGCIYLPHHAALKKTSSTTKLRVVFDASLISSNGRSLNDNLMCGPVIQSDLFSIISRFRVHQYTFSGDIEKMYRQIRVHPDDTKLQLIFWRNNSCEPIKTFKLLTLTYGTKSASFLATRCLKELADKYENDYAKASEVIRNDFYMDDLLTGADSIPDLIKIKTEVTRILHQGGFELRKFKSNCTDVLSINDQQDTDANINLSKTELSKILGLCWNSKQDIFKFEIELNSLPNKITKRTILSATAQIFDPLGLLGPMIMKAKIILQQLWSIKTNWDKSVPSGIHTTWSLFLNQLHAIKNIHIPRKIIACHPSNLIELHGFCDASLQGYGAAIYIRTRNSDGGFDTRLLCSKSRVAPLKIITLPRLELCGALLLANLVDKVRQAIKLDISQQFLWTDSTIVLAWINTSPSSLKIFVANRISEINSLTNARNWHHVKSENNAADILSRGVLPSELIKNEMWFHGPGFLKHEQKLWPPSVINTKSEIPDIRIAAPAIIENHEFPALTRYSTFIKLQRVIAWVLRFWHNFNKNNPVKFKGDLCAKELNNASQRIVSFVQKVEFAAEIKALSTNKTVSTNSKLLSLNPFVDEKGLIRVGGRLKNASVANDTKYPIVLPKNHFVTKLIIRQSHEKHLHAGPQATLAAIRQRYWVLSGRSVTRQVLHSCVKCFKVNPANMNPKMGDLPATRVTPSRPFMITGIDYAGPVLTKESRGRGKRLVKSYIAIFVCFSTKAVHVELVPDLSTEEFLGALKRFIGRRGLPTDIYSENATNFVGANIALKDLIQFFAQDEFKNKFQDEVAELGITWHFIPPKAPHMGGLWEINVKAVKTHLKRTVGNANLTFSEMNTLLVRIESCLNSRPLTQMSSDPNDLETLTPGHFLIGQPLTEFPEYDLSDVQENRLSRWQLLERIRAHFWNRWSREYLTQLQARTKWRTASPSLQVGNLVILMEDNVPPLCWRTGRITETHPGNDGNVRVVTVRTKQGTFKRAAARVCVLPIETE